MLSSTLLALAASLSTVSAVYQGFNYGATSTAGAPFTLNEYIDQFNAAKALAGTNGAFTSARIFTLIQAGTVNTPSDAIQAAIDTNTPLLLGLWASAGQAGIDNELAALSSAITTYGPSFTNLIAGISVGSEDLYRISPIGIENLSGIGAGPSEIADYIGQVKSAIADTDAKGKLVGHVDTWTAWVNGSNSAVIAASDFIGMDAYPYFQNTMPNDVTNGYSLFNAAYEATVAAVGDKPVYITETGWPVSGSTSNQAVPGTANAQTYWDQVGCNKLFGQINTWWFTLQDSNPTTPNPSFGIMGTDLTGAPLFDLSCSGVSTSVPSSPIPAASATADAVSINAAGAGNEGTPNTAANGGASSSTSSSDVSNTAIAAAAGSLPVTTGSSTAQPEEDAPLMTTYTTVTTCPVTTTSEGKAITTSTTSTVIIESCLGGCSSKTAIAAEAGVPTTLATITKTSVLPKASASGVSASSCPASLSGAFEYPHLIVPISKDSPTTAGGTSYNGTFSSTESAIFNFDIPASDSGKTCSLVFLLPTQAELTTSAFSLSGSGGLDVAQLKSAATEETSYNTVPAVVSDLGGPTDVTPGNAYIISSGSCAAGQTLSYEVSATGSLDLNYFQDYNLPPIGFYITVC